MKYVNEPNLPEKVKVLVIGEKYSESLQKALENMGITVLLASENPELDKRVSGHADLSVLHLGGREIALAPYLKGSGLHEQLLHLGMAPYFPQMLQSAEYPNDVGLNLCICGNKLICNSKTAEKSIVRYLTKSRGFESLKVKQGYSKCSVCVVDHNSIITSDEGIHKRAVEAGLDSLKITSGYIELPGFDYGFIGGAAFKLEQNVIAFTGHLDMHPDRDLIFEFLGLHNIKQVYITEKPAFDIGSAIQIVENDSPP